MHVDACYVETMPGFCQVYDLMKKFGLDAVDIGGYALYVTEKCGPKPVQRFFPPSPFDRHLNGGHWKKLIAQDGDDDEDDVVVTGYVVGNKDGVVCKSDEDVVVTGYVVGNKDGVVCKSGEEQKEGEVVVCKSGEGGEEQKEGEVVVCKSGEGGEKQKEGEVVVCKSGEKQKEAEVVVCKSGEKQKEAEAEGSGAVKPIWKKKIGDLGPSLWRRGEFGWEKIEDPWISTKPARPGPAPGLAHGPAPGLAHGPAHGLARPDTPVTSFGLLLEPMKERIEPTTEAMEEEEEPMTYLTQLSDGEDEESEQLMKM